MNTRKSRCNQALDLTRDERRVAFKNHNESSSKVMLFILKARDYMCALAVIIGIGTGASVGAVPNNEDVPNEEAVPKVDDTQAPTTKAPSRFSRLARSVKAGAGKVVQETSNASKVVTQKGKKLAQGAVNGTAKKVVKAGAKAAVAAVPGGAVVLVAARVANTVVPRSVKRKTAKAAEAAARKAAEAAARKAAGVANRMASKALGATSKEVWHPKPRRKP